jgi:hypothetical protein
MGGIEHATIQVIKQEPPAWARVQGPARHLRRRYGP